MNNYIKISEAAERWGITLTSAYRKAKKEYSEYIKKIDNQTYISIKVFDTVNEKEQDINNNNDIIAILNKQLQDKQSTIEYLKAELTAKNQDIKHKDDIIIEMSNRLSILLEREQAKGLIEKRAIIEEKTKDNEIDDKTAAKGQNNWFSRFFRRGIK